MVLLKTKKEVILLSFWHRIHLQFKESKKKK